MQKENDTKEEGSLGTTEVVEAPEKESKGLTRREALAVAIDANNEELSKKEEEEVVVREEVKKEVPRYEAPGEWTKEEKEDFRELSPKQQEANLRLYNSRKSTLREITDKRQELETYRKLAEAVDPYVKSMGTTDSAEVAIQKALNAVAQLKSGDKKAIREFFDATGVDPRTLYEESDEEKEDAKISSLQKEINELKIKEAQKEELQLQSAMVQNWNTFREEKNATGASKFPDINDTESGIRLTSSIGSLVNGKTDLSRQFIESIKARIPDLTYPKLFEEAYKFYGGKVDESPINSRSQDSQKHLIKAKRASASVPGRGSSGSVSAPVKKYKTYKEAAAAALSELRELEG